jgi:Fe-S-cluster containining protein
MQDQTQAGPDALSVYFFQIADAAQKEALAPSDALFSIIRQVLSAAALVLDSVAGTCESPVPECASGCSFCCHSRIHVMPLEVVVICSYVHNHFSPKALQGLKTRIRTNLSYTRGRSLAQRVAVKDQTPCVFLDHQACSIYDQRPFICRTWNSLSRQDCETAFVSGDKNAEIPCLSAPNYVYTLARDVVQGVCETMHLETGRFELVSAMDRCLGMKDAQSDWTGGCTVFGRSGGDESREKTEKNSGKEER